MLQLYFNSTLHSKMKVVENKTGQVSVCTTHMIFVISRKSIWRLGGRGVCIGLGYGGLAGREKVSGNSQKWEISRKFYMNAYTVLCTFEYMKVLGNTSTWG